MIVVHHLERSRSQRILWLLEELGVPYEVKGYKRDPQTQLGPPELKQVHPLGKAPVIEHDGQVIAESGAIIEYILRRHGRGRLQPAPSSASYDEYSFWIHYAEGSVMPALIMKIIAPRFGEAAAPSMPRFDSEVALHLNYINTRLESRSYLLGDELTAADIQLGFVSEIVAARLGLAGYPNIDAWGKRLQARPAYKAAVARGGAYSSAS